MSKAFGKLLQMQVQDKWLKSLRNEYMQQTFTKTHSGTFEQWKKCKMSIRGIRSHEHIKM